MKNKIDRNQGRMVEMKIIYANGSKSETGVLCEDSFWGQLDSDSPYFRLGLDDEVEGVIIFKKSIDSITTREIE